MTFRLLNVEQTFIVLVLSGIQAAASIVMLILDVMQMVKERKESRFKFDD